MSQIPRFKVVSPAEYADGEYVLYRDYLRLEQELAEANATIVRLRTALIESGRNAGALLADEVSNDFLMHIPEEVKLKIARLQGENERLSAPITDKDWGVKTPRNLIFDNTFNAIIQARKEQAK